MTSAPVDTVGAFVAAPSVLLAGAEDGPLAGTALAVKDVLDVAGTVTGAGNPDFAASREPATQSAAAVDALVAAGATVVGKTITDELAFSLSGTNAHLGTPVNVAAPGRIPGGSSAGSAAAVAAGLVDLALGTDTGGSVRVPASYCGIAGWRPTHGRVDAAGLVHLARSFDTVGLLAHDAGLLATAGAVLAGPDHPGVAAPAEAVVVAELLDQIDPVAGVSVRAAVDAAPVEPLDVDLVVLGETFRPLQGREAWAEHGAWITSARPRFGRGVAARFAAASHLTDEEVLAAQARRDAVRALIAEATAGGRVLVGPAAAGAALPLDAAPAAQASRRARTIRITCLASLAGAPVVVLPLGADEGLPLGVAFLGAPGSDVSLLCWCAALVGS